jgi:hypothetical protein
MQKFVFFRPPFFYSVVMAWALRVHLGKFEDTKISNKNGCRYLQRLDLLPVGVLESKTSLASALYYYNAQYICTAA